MCNPTISTKSLSALMVHGTGDGVARRGSILHEHLSRIGYCGKVALVEALQAELIPALAMAAACVLDNDAPGTERLQLAFVAGERMRELQEETAQQPFPAQMTVQIEAAVSTHLLTLGECKDMEEVDTFMTHLHDLLTAEDGNSVCTDYIAVCEFAAAAWMAAELGKLPSKYLPRLTRRHAELCTWLWQTTSPWDLHLITTGRMGRLFFIGTDKLPEDEAFILRELERLAGTIPASKFAEVLDRLTEQDKDNETVKSFRKKMTEIFM